MSIQRRLLLVFTVLIIAGVMTIAAYSILFIRNYLIDEGKRNMLQDADWMAVTIAQLPPKRLQPELERISEASNYQLALFDSAGAFLTAFPRQDLATVPAGWYRELTERGKRRYLLDLEEREELYVFAHVPDSQNRSRFVQLSQSREATYAVVEQVRWIIYTGIFLTLGIVLVVSWLVARNLARPIKQLQTGAEAIAAGETSKTLRLKRSDEFGKLAEALNHMAAKLRADAEELKSANARQQQFYADITHELRNPLHTILATLELAEIADQMPPEQRDDLHATMRRQAERMQRLFRDLQTLQKLEADPYALERQSFDFKKLAQLVIESHQSAAQQKGLQLELRGDAMTLHADKARIQQVLDNLVSNAIKYTDRGVIRISWSAGEPFACCVTDTGPGIAPEHLPKLFNRFYRTDDARARETGGSGLGLAIAQRIIQAHGGDITVESTLGQGSRFCFSV